MISTLTRVAVKTLGLAVACGAAGYGIGAHLGRRRAIAVFGEDEPIRLVPTGGQHGR